MQNYWEKRLEQEFSILVEMVETHITESRVLKYVEKLINTPAPSTLSAWTRGPVLKELLGEDGVLDLPEVAYYEDYQQTGNVVVLTGKEKSKKALWYFAHLDTISYLIQPIQGERYPLVPFCYHLIDGRDVAGEVIRFHLEAGKYETVIRGKIITESGEAYFQPDIPIELRPGDRVVISSRADYDQERDLLYGHLDNAGAVAALAVALPIIAKMGMEALFAFTDEEEGPQGGENQTIGRGARRIIDHFQTPQTVIATDIQRAIGLDEHPNPGDVVIGAGAVLAEFSSYGRGAVTPPHLYVLTKKMADQLEKYNVKIQESNNLYTSRSDDINAFQKTPNIVLLGFPGINRHFDQGLPTGSLKDLVALAKSFVYYAVLPRLMENLKGDAR